MRIEVRKSDTFTVSSRLWLYRGDASAPVSPDGMGDWTGIPRTADEYDIPHTPAFELMKCMGHDPVYVEDAPSPKPVADPQKGEPTVGTNEFDDGGLAFGSTRIVNVNGECQGEVFDPGMTLRDYFAAHAGDPPLSYMQRACNIEDPGSVGSLEYCQRVAEWRGAMADAQLAERKKKEASNG